MKRAEISSTMLVFIIIAVIAMALFITFFYFRGADLFGQFGQISPSESETARDACQIACNSAKLRSTCDEWESVYCNKIYGKTEATCWDALPDTCRNVEKQDESCGC